MKAATFSCAVSLVVATPSPDVLTKFRDFRAKWGRVYVGTEFTRRLGYFEKHVADVETLQQLEQGTAIYSHLGPFADASPEEMTQRKGFRQPRNLEHQAPVPLLNSSVSVPSSLDWVAKGCVNPIQNQGVCGSCWAFSTAANLEGAGCVSNGRLVKVSEQNILDCDSSCYSCLGGLPSRALTWSSQNGGVASEQDYPYEGFFGEFERCRKVAKLVQNSGYSKIGRSEDSIKQALVKYGPLSIAVDASPFQSYHSGIMKNPSCSQTKLDHAINIVGYSHSDNLFYWKIRNSWGASWGEEGYIRLAGDCTCGLCTTVVTATGVTFSDSSHPTHRIPQLIV